MTIIKRSFLCISLLASGLSVTAQQEPVTDTNTPLHLLQPDYPTPYGKPEAKEVLKVLDRVYSYLDATTPARLMNGKTQKEITDLKQLNENTVFAPGDFRLTSYEWGVTYAGMLLAGEVTGDQKYTDYTYKRLKLIADIAPYYREQLKKDPDSPSPIRSVLDPHALDDAGAICAAMIKAKKQGAKFGLTSIIDHYIDYISTREFRLKDGTLARNRPQPNTIWLDDLFMSVPALAQMGKLTGEKKYFDDAVKQVLQFSERMFNKEKGLYMHGWVQAMKVHPEFHWGRANGWAVMTLVELLDVLPPEHKGYNKVLTILRAHIKGLISYQDGTGFWHQLLDCPDTYLETSATAIYTYSIARAINKGYVDKLAYAPAVLLGWNAVATKVNEKGQVEGTCVGTGMGFDPAFYYYRPVNVYAAHGYGPVLLAGAEVLNMLKKHQFEINDSSLQLLGHDE
ncbi:glycoside hydrolase family 88/105 protein [Sinomicrobium weinanense]|uniref:Glycoside hydrolase family 88 protein n=1 Tax=Sinomicrobium weinanense TaxID=2842200 RepID=A0A926JW77_9FLAO|nr:glycoside hydrolase family 88 protein [Sinomicrobium weinanense]MBC9798327.1 glycoside hydrolase family 88 protein [Sinomicrobium weinanense]MBU3125577.1 glycoside hydrolase family 88 protein [Sinomicrobium weinanense]